MRCGRRFRGPFALFYRMYQPRTFRPLSPAAGARVRRAPRAPLPPPRSPAPATTPR